MKPALTQERLKELLHYDPETGNFIRRLSQRSDRVGARAGTWNTKGYRLILADGRRYLAHRLAFLYMTGVFPPAEVDHINRVKDDNRWSNLRLATAQENKGNQGPRRNNTSGHRGVTWHKHAKKWMAYGGLSGRLIYLGLFCSVDEAAVAAKKWRAENFGVFAEQ